MICPNCGSENFVKNGIVHGRQRFLCKNCLCTYTRVEWRFFSLKKKQTTIKDYFRRGNLKKTAEKAEISRVTLDAWLKQLIQNIAEIEDFKNELSLQNYEKEELNFLTSNIKERGWIHPLSKKQLIELSSKYLDTLMLLLRRRPKKKKDIKKTFI